MSDNLMNPFEISKKSLDMYYDLTSMYLDTITSSDSEEQTTETVPFELHSVSSETKTITSETVEQFADVSEDTNPLHLNKSVAESGPFNDKIAHGILVLGLVSSTLAKYDGEIVFTEINSVKFTNPVYIGNTITAESEITHIDGNQATVDFEVHNVDSDETVLLGQVTILDAADMDL